MTSAPDPGTMFEGEGELALRMRDVDWSSTSLGSVDRWSQSLRSALSICLGSPFPIALYWGPELVLLYNDAWSPILGSKHPSALGCPAKAVWPEIWDTIEPLFDQVMTTGRGNYQAESLLAMHRHGYTEECYFDFTFSPVRGDEGVVEGVFNAVVETTERVIAARRTRVLRELAEAMSSATSAREACRLAAESLRAAGHDVTFCLVYLVDSEGNEAMRVACEGLPEDHALAPERVAASATAPSRWPVFSVRTSGRAEVVSSLSVGAAQMPGGVWPEPTDAAIVVPFGAGSGAGVGVLILGTSPRRRVDDDYVHFAERAAALLARVAATAEAFADERRRAEALAELDRAKTAFFSNVSHEFRTPLTLILGPVEDALRSPDPRLEGDELDSVHRNALRLLKLVNTLLDFSRAEAGRSQPRFEPTDLAAVTSELASAFRTAVERGGLRYTVRCERLPSVVHVDRDMWEQIVLNLISNAFKFTFEGEIELVLAARNDHAVLSVRDTGVGIAADQVQHLFERFHRVDEVRARTHEGSGIGLALVQELVRVHGGEVRVESEPGRGATFTVMIPFGTGHLPAERIAPAATSSLSPPRRDAFVAEALGWATATVADDGVGDASAGPIGAPSGAAHVLVVDDNADMRGYIARMLQRHWRVTAVADGGQALRAIEQQPFDVVVTDVMMPVLDGFGLLERLKSDPSTRSIPVVMLSARAGEDARVEGLRAGADDYLVKPFSGRELVARIATQVELARTRATLERAHREELAANRAKDEFLAMLGHELRNPLAPMRLAVTLLGTMLAKGEDPGRPLEILGRQLDNLSRLVDDLLDVARVSRGRLELQREELELSHVVRRALDVVQGMFEDKEHEVQVTMPGRRVPVSGDAVRLEQVVVNLLTNAAKYTDRGGRISVVLTTGQGIAELRVADSGIGIPPEKLELVFHVFEQIGRDLSRSQGGLGVGLTIAHRLVALHGGSLEARSAGVGKGSEFIVRLPLSVDAPRRASAPAIAPFPPAGAVDVASRPVRVLVVDDNADAAEMIAEVLNILGHDCRVALDGPTALEIASSTAPELVILDLGMPGMDGYEVARRLLELDGPRPILAALSGYGQPKDVERSMAVGFDRHLVKPATFATIAALLDFVRSETRVVGD